MAEQITVELVTADGQSNLPTDEREALAELQQELLHVVDERGLQVPFRALLGGPEEIEDVRIAGGLPCRRDSI